MTHSRGGAGAGVGAGKGGWAWWERVAARAEVAGFLTRPISLVNDIEVLDWNQVVEQVFNWQVCLSHDCH